MSDYCGIARVLQGAATLLIMMLVEKQFPIIYPVLKEHDE